MVKGVVTGLHACVNGVAQFLSIGPNCSVILAAGITRIDAGLGPALVSDQPERSEQGTDGRNLISHVRSNMYFKVLRSALDPGNTLPSLLQTGALLVRGTAPQGKFQIQVTASADMGETRRLALRNDPRYRPAGRASGEPAGGLDLVRVSRRLAVDGRHGAPRCRTSPAAG